jgi:hypothetical protein
VKRLWPIVLVAAVSCHGNTEGSEREKNELSLLHGLNVQLDKGATLPPRDTFVSYGWSICAERPVATECVLMMERTHPETATWQKEFNKALAEAGPKLEPWRSRTFHLACEQNAVLISKLSEKDLSAWPWQDAKDLSATCAAKLPKAAP